MKVDREDALSMISEANQCGDHPFDFNVDNIKEFIFAQRYCCCGEGHCGSWCDSDSAVVMEMVNEEQPYAVVSEWSDTSGHG